MYDPRVGVWLNLDPIGFEAGDANPNRYVGNSPTNATDPSGLEPPLSTMGPGSHLYDLGYAGNEESYYRDAAIEFIKKNRASLSKQAAEQFLRLLDSGRPKGPGVPADLTQNDVGKVADALAEAYVTTVEKLLQKWPGAKPSNGMSFTMWLEFFGRERTEENIAWEPLCVDWCRELIGEFRIRASNTVVPVSAGPVRLLNFVEAKWGQQWNIVGEHNYPVVYPKGHEASDDRPTSYVILDAWPSLKPTVVSADKYRADMITSFNNNIANARRIERTKARLRHRTLPADRPGGPW